MLYSVHFEGLENDPHALRDVQQTSQLVRLQTHPPSSMRALHHRAELDIPGLLEVMRSHGYYEASAAAHIDPSGAHVAVHIQPGPLYRICALRYNHIGAAQAHNQELSALHVQLPCPARAKWVVEAETALLHTLANRGYPLATIAHRDVVADGASKMVSISLDIHPGVLCRFGPTSIQGLSSVDPSVVRDKVEWNEGDLYSQQLVDATQSKLREMGIFHSLSLSFTPPPSQSGTSEALLPMTVELREGKQRSLSMGFSYQTSYGSGITIDWEHRNVLHRGYQLSLQADVAQRNHAGVAKLLIPEFRKRGCKLLCEAVGSHVALIKAYKERSYSIEARLESHHKILAAVAERISLQSSAQDGCYWLLRAPLHVQFGKVDDPLDPKRGQLLECRSTPAAIFSPYSSVYFGQQLIYSTYLSWSTHPSLVLAQRTLVGALWSPSPDKVPLSKKFLGGSEEQLRGYRSHTVSPLDAKRRPEGGCSAVYCTLEVRLRLFAHFGLVPFFDFGNVWADALPTTRGKWVKSVGIGMRYFSFLGPLRLDIAVPLDRRAHLDPRYQLLASVGQSF